MLDAWWVFQRLEGGREVRLHDRGHESDEFRY